MPPGRRVARRTARRTARRVTRRRAFFAAPLMFRRPVIRRPLGTILVVGAMAGVAYKLGKAEIQSLQEYTGVPPDQLSEDELKAAMQDLKIQSQPLDQQDLADVRLAQAGGGAPTPQALPPQSAPTGGESYLDELERLADLRDRGVITPEDFEAKKRQLLGL